MTAWARSGRALVAKFGFFAIDHEKASRKVADLLWALPLLARWWFPKYSVLCPGQRVLRTPNQLTDGQTSEPTRPTQTTNFVRIFEAIRDVG